MAHPRWIESRCGFGSRSIHDNAPFSLWDVENTTFRRPSWEEKAWIFKEYRASSVTFTFPEIIIKSDTPPNPIPLTVGCVAVHFVPEDFDETLLMGKGDTYLSNPRTPDPVSYRPLSRWLVPPADVRRKISTELKKVADVKSVIFRPPSIEVELKNNGRLYARHSLPGIIAGLSVLYSQQKETKTML